MSCDNEVFNCKIVSKFRAFLASRSEHTMTVSSLAYFQLGTAKIGKRYSLDQAAKSATNVAKQTRVSLATSRRQRVFFA